MLGIPITYGYRFEGNVNGKNIYGAYVSFVPFSGIIRNDGDQTKVVRYCLTDTTSEFGLCNTQMVYY